MVGGLQHITFKEKLREPGEEKAEGDLLAAFMFLMGECRDDRASLFLEACSNRTKASNDDLHKLSRYKDYFSLVFFTMRVLKH